MTSVRRQYDIGILILKFCIDIDMSICLYVYIYIAHFNQN